MKLKKIENRFYSIIISEWKQKSFSEFLWENEKDYEQLKDFKTAQNKLLIIWTQSNRFLKRTNERNSNTIMKTNTIDGNMFTTIFHILISEESQMMIWNDLMNIIITSVLNVSSTDNLEKIQKKCIFISLYSQENGNDIERISWFKAIESD